MAHDRPPHSDDEYHEHFAGPSAGIPAERELETAERDAKIVEASIRGKRINELMDEFGLSRRQIARIIRDAAVRVREQAVDLAAQAFHRQAERLERLYRLVEMELTAYEEYMLAVRAAQGKGVTLTPVTFDDKPFRVAVAIFDRQAKLLGLDRGKDQQTGPTGWLDDAPIQQVVDYAKQLKMKLPSEFET